MLISHNFREMPTYLPNNRFHLKISRHDNACKMFTQLVADLMALEMGYNPFRTCRLDSLMSGLRDAPCMSCGFRLDIKRGERFNRWP